MVKIPEEHGGGRFQFANVNVDTKFVLIDDLESELSTNNYSQ